MNPTPGNTGTSQAQPLAIGEVAELQDQLFEAATDLDRLGGLLEDATRQLMERFSAANEQAQLLLGDLESREGLRRELAGAVTALQFQDMAAQVISHTVQRIRGVADFIGSRAVADDDEAESVAVVELVRRHCPVAQRQVDAGSIELF
jgi:hypothetical protein